MKDVVWIVTESEQYEGSVSHLVTVDRDKAVKAYYEHALRSDAWVSFSLERWENGVFIEHEKETD